MHVRHFNKIVGVVSALIVMVAIAGCGGGDGKKVEVNSQGLDANGCKPADKPKPKTVNLPKPDVKLDTSKRHKVVFETNCGAFTVKLDVKNNPITTASFAYLAEKGVYDGTWFHRIVKNFAVQGGDPKGDGTGDAGYKVTERPKSAYKIGSVAMAKGGKDPIGMSGSQFFIVWGPQGAMLNIDYAIVGKISSGDDTIQRISSYGPPGTSKSETPVGVAIINKATHTASK